MGALEERLAVRPEAGTRKLRLDLNQIFQGIPDLSNNKMGCLYYRAMNTLTSPVWQRSPGMVAVG